MGGITINIPAFESNERQCEAQCQHILGTGVAAGNLAQLHFIITHQQVNAILGSIFELG